MASHLQSKLIARLLQDARLLVEQANGQREELDALISAAEDDVDRAEAIAVQATTGDVYQVRRLLRLHLQRTSSSVARVKHLRGAAEEQLAVACRLLTGLNTNGAVASDPVSTSADSRRKRASRKSPRRRAR